MIAARIEKVEPTPNEPDDAVRPMDPVVEAALTENHRAFLRFLTRRLGDESAAEDIARLFASGQGAVDDCSLIDADECLLDDVDVEAVAASRFEENS